MNAECSVLFVCQSPQYKGGDCHACCLSAWTQIKETMMAWSISWQNV